MAEKMTDVKIFDKKKMSDVLREVYDSASTKMGAINALIDYLETFRQNAGIFDSEMASSVAKLYDVGIKNDESLVKIATIAQRLITAEMRNTGPVDDGILTEEEVNKLRETVEEVKSKIPSVTIKKEK